MKKKYAGVTPFCLKTKNILIVQRSLDISSPLKWCSFGGGIEDGESPLFAAKREFEEESGLNLYFKIIKASYDHQLLDGTYINYWGLFDEEFTPKVGVTTDDGAIEIINYAWVPPQKAIEQYDLIFGFECFLEQAFKDLKEYL